MSVITSSPCKGGTKNKSQAGNLDYRVKQVENDLKADIANAIKCDFDRLLSHFIYLVLDEQDDKKKAIDNLQSKIEELQERRYYPQAETKVYETAREATVADDVGAEDEEVELIRQRDEILAECRDGLLEEVLDIANAGPLKDALKAYCSEVETNEKERYGKYVLLCNLALERLEDVDAETFGIREASSLELCFQRSDPKPLQSRYDGMERKVKRNPDVVATSRVAALDVADQGKFEQIPKMPLSWCQPFMALEFKLLEKDLMGKFDDTAKADFTVISRTDTIEQNMLEASDPTPVILNHEEQETGRKRKSRADHQDGPACKSRRSTNRAISKPGRGSAMNISTSRSPSTHSASEFMGTSESEKAVSHRVQLATYALEMLSYSLGVHHAINLLIIDDMLWVWYYDRQGIIQSDGISIIADFPRFLVLLLVFQRFTLKDWGIIPALNPDAACAHEDNLTLRVVSGTQAITNLDPTVLEKGHLQDGNIKSITLQLKQFLSHEPHCLAGRATAVIAGNGTRDGDADLGMVCKIYHPEIQRRHEGKTLEVVHHIADEEDPDMKKHLPTMFFYGDIPGCTTHRIRSIIKRRWKGHRTLRIIGFKKLEEMTEHSGIDFINAWLEVVTCHAFLWKHHVEHGDPSLSNMMYDPDLKCGVLTDFDLSILQWEPHVIGTDRTGTIPYMATDLLTEAYWRGQIKRLYRHELEAFIWVLPFTFLLYQDGLRRSNAYVDPWRTSDYNVCREKKNDFQDDSTFTAAASTVQADFKGFWRLVYFLFRALDQAKTARKDRFDARMESADLEDDEGNYGDTTGLVTPEPTDAGLESKEMWDFFISALDRFARTMAAQHRSGFSDLVTRLKIHQLDFIELSDEEATLLREKYALFLRHPSTNQAAH